MNLWKMELIHLFRSWRGWTLLAVFTLASVLSLIVGVFIDRASAGFSYSDALELYITVSIVGTLLWIGIVVSSLAFDSNKDSSIFLRTRFSMKQILMTKLLIYVPLSQILFFLGFLLTLIVGLLIFDSSDHVSLNWFLWGMFFYLISNLHYAALMLFTSSIFRGAVASVLLTLAVFIGIPLIGSTLITVELLMRGLIDRPLVEWETVSFVALAVLWWPAALNDTLAFLTVTQSDIQNGTLTYFGMSLELDAHFRQKALITAIATTPVFAVLAWQRFSSREI